LAEFLLFCLGTGERPTFPFPLGFLFDSSALTVDEVFSCFAFDFFFDFEDFLGLWSTRDTALVLGLGGKSFFSVAMAFSFSLLSSASKSQRRPMALATFSIGSQEISSSGKPTHFTSTWGRPWWKRLPTIFSTTNSWVGSLTW